RGFVQPDFISEPHSDYKLTALGCQGVGNHAAVNARMAQHVRRIEENSLHGTQSIEWAGILRRAFLTAFAKLPTNLLSQLRVHARLRAAGADMCPYRSLAASINSVMIARRS